MLINEINIVCRRLTVNDFENLSKYLDQLSSESRKRFGPHAFDINTIIAVYTKSDSHIGYITVEEKSSKIIAYAIILKGYLEHDNQRLQSYGIIPEHLTDCTYAPSVADDWQGRGVGTELFKFILGDLQKTSFRRIILWGGVQTGNERAVRFYKNNGFTILGEFQNNGNNLDMICNYRLT